MKQRNAMRKFIATVCAFAVVTTNVFSVSAFADNDKNKDKGNKKPSYSSEIEHGKPGHECSHDCDEKIGKGHHKDDDDYVKDKDKDKNKNEGRDDDDDDEDRFGVDDDRWDDDDEEDEAEE